MIYDETVTRIQVRDNALWLRTFFYPFGECSPFISSDSVAGYDKRSVFRPKEQKRT
jgi:hypothetical protein